MHLPRHSRFELPQALFHSRHSAYERLLRGGQGLASALGGARWLRLEMVEGCSFEEFRDKFVRVAEQNRAPEIRLGQEIANRTRQYFHDYLDDLSADMPSVEQWTEPLTDKVHYRWRPQKDCFYIDENIDDYLSELYEFVRMK